MPEVTWMERESARSLQRILPHLKQHYQAQKKHLPEHAWETYEKRLTSQFPRLFGLLLHLYGGRYDFFYHLEAILKSALDSWEQRSSELCQLDAERESQQDWFHNPRMVGGMLYVDLFAGNLKGIREKIPYFKELGLTYVHLMPLFKTLDGENDGGYAVSSYRDVQSALGSMDDLTELSAEFRKNGISLVIDFIFNHTSKKHDWAQKAAQGDPDYQEYYWMYENRHIPDQFEQNLRAIFPDQGGNFTYFEDIHRWVWTTFYPFQWDLNYSNPAVFRAMMEEMLFLANQGVEVLRMDAVAFIWKKMGTNCENQPEAHMILQAYNALLQIAAPAVLFKSEAIVHPDEVIRYISPNECQLSYNPLLMALLWESLATRDSKLLRYSMQKRFRIDPNCAWVNYIRCHDDIGWTFSDEDAEELGISGYSHRRFLNAFYTGRFEGSFARGLPFQENPLTGDARINGTLASLAGLEKGLQENNPEEKALAIQKILLLHSIILSIGGIPLLYLGDEVAMLNDYSYVNDELKEKDSRWVHRPFRQWGQEQQYLKIEQHPAQQVYSGIRDLIQSRKNTPAFAKADMEVVYTGNDHVFGYIRSHEKQRVLVLANFSEGEQSISTNEIRLHGFGYQFQDLVSQRAISLSHDFQLAPYQFVWLSTTSH